MNTLLSMLAVIGGAALVHASPLTVTTQDNGGIWTYHYSILNNTAGDIFSLSLMGNGFEVLLGQSDAPQGWLSLENTDSVFWFALDVSSNVSIGSEILGFTIRSMNGPGDALATLLLADPISGEFYDQITVSTAGPTGPRDSATQVPEPSLFCPVLMLLVGILWTTGYKRTKPSVLKAT